MVAIQEFTHKKVRATHSGSSEQTEPQGSTTELFYLNGHTLRKINKYNKNKIKLRKNKNRMVRILNLVAKHLPLSIVSVAQRCWEDGDDSEICTETDG